MYEAAIHAFQYSKIEKFGVKYKFITENGISSAWSQLWEIQQVSFVHRTVYKQEASVYSAVSLVC